VTVTSATLPDGFVVRLHDDVEIGPQLVRGGRLLRLSPVARDLLRSRSLRVSSPATAGLAGRLLDLDLAVPAVPDGPGIADMTVVVPVRDNATGVDRLLVRLAAHVRCVVVDDASADPRAVARVVDRHGATLVRLDRNVGPAAARDAGLRMVRTPLVAFVDSDVDVSPDVLAHLAGHFADPGLAAAAPRIRSGGGRRWFQRYDEACSSLDLGPQSATVRPWTRVAYVPSACLVARVDTLGAGFDPHLRSGEDVDLIWRLQAGGHRVRYRADVEASHDARRTIGSWLGRSAFYGASAAPLAQRHGDKVAPAVLSPLGVAMSAALLLQRRWSPPVVIALTVWQMTAVGRRLPELSRRRRGELVGRSSIALARQTSGLALRHWWPVSLLLAARSRRARRALTVMAFADGIAAHRAADAGLDLPRFVLARRLDDLAYGAGVWWGALRGRSTACLRPRWSPSGGRADG
jgi:mycofactocin system glycosyltransferase